MVAILVGSELELVSQSTNGDVEEGMLAGALPLFECDFDLFFESPFLALGWASTGA